MKILAYYFFTDLDNPTLEVKKHKEFFKEKDIKGRIYLSKQGINGTLSGSAEDVEAYMEWLKSDERFAGIEFKIDEYHEHAFAKLAVKEREQLVAIDTSFDLKKGGMHVPPKMWKKMLEERDDDTIVLDVRNDYEWEVGHFEGSELPKLETFRQFPQYAKDLKKKRDPKNTKVMMYCTGGIRCEIYSALLKEEGFERVVQLDGGVIKYGKEVGGEHWKGQLFVFDDRLTVPMGDEEIGRCTHCNTKSSTYYNCANMDCNALFLSCKECSAQFRGCCSTECTSEKRVRPFEQANNPKPFRKLPFEEKQKLVQ